MSARVETALLDVLENLQQQQQLWVAYSGGVDSTVLVAALHRLTTAHALPPIHLLHVNHGLQAEAENWVQHCQEQAKIWQLPLDIVHLHSAPKKGESIEAWAREQRYAVFAQKVAANQLLLLAQHQDDQAETVLLQLLRGAGPKGLSAMPKQRQCGAGHLLRPFLSMPKSEIVAYAQNQKLQWVHDQSNADERYDRNYCRHHIMPALQQRWPNAAKALSRSAAHCASQQAVIDNLVEASFAECRDGERLNIEALLQCQPLLQPLILRRWVRHCWQQYPSTRHLEMIMAQVIHAQPDQQPALALPGTEARIGRYRGYLYWLKPQVPRQHFDMKWDGREPLTVPRLDEPLTKASLEAMGLALSESEWQQVRVQSRRGGERCRLKGHPHHQSLKKCFQAFGIPAWKREQMPLIYCGDRLVMVVGGWLCD